MAPQKAYSVTGLGPRSAMDILFFLIQHFQLWKMERTKGKKEARKEGGRDRGKKERDKIDGSWIPSVPESNRRSSAISCIAYYLVLHGILLRKVFYSTNKFANHRWTRWSARYWWALGIVPNPVAGTSPAIAPASNQRIPLLLMLLGACCLS